MSVQAPDLIAERTRDGRERLATERLWTAIEASDVTALGASLRDGANPRAKNEFGLPALSSTCTRDATLPLTKALLKHVAARCESVADCVNETWAYGLTALRNAVVHGASKTASYLLANGARVDIADEDGIGVLFTTINLQKIDLLKQMLTCLKAAPEEEWERATRQRTVRNSVPLLHVAVDGGNVELVKVMLRARWPLDVVGYGDRTAVQMARDHGRTEMVELLEREETARKGHF